MEPKSTAIYNFLERKIAAGEYEPGDRLPSEAELCSEFNVSRGPVRAALDQLTAIGLVMKKKGGGSYVREQDPANFVNAILPTLRFHGGDYREILQLRTSLDKLSLELCLENHETNDYGELESVAEAMDKVRSADDFFPLDRTFHTIISTLSGNRLLHSVNLLIWDLLEHSPKEELYAEGIEKPAFEYRRIYRCIRENDPELASIYTVRNLRKMLNPDKKIPEPSKDTHRWNPWLYDTL